MFCFSYPYINSLFFLILFCLVSLFFLFLFLTTPTSTSWRTVGSCAGQEAREPQPVSLEFNREDQQTNKQWDPWLWFSNENYHRSGHWLRANAAKNHKNHRIVAWWGSSEFFLFMLNLKVLIRYFDPPSHSLPGGPLPEIMEDKEIDAY